MKNINIFVLFLLILFQSVFAQNLFQTGQEAEVILGIYGTNATASCVHHPGDAESDGQRLYVADTRNNRILIWNSIPTTNNQPADIVVGQPDMYSNYSDGGPTGLNWPVRLTTDGDALIVTDTNNNRVLIWNHIPTQNYEPADVVLGQPDFYTYNMQERSSSSLLWPWGVHYDGTRLYVVDTGEARVLVWNSLPTVNNQPADLVLGQKTFESIVDPIPSAYNMWSPRGIASDGKSLAVSDYQWHRILIWNSIPTENGQDADCVLIQDDFNHTEDTAYLGFGGDIDLCIYGDKLFLPTQTYIYIWDKVPVTNNPSPDHRFGWEDAFTAGTWSTSYDGQHVFVTNTNGSRVLIYNEIPQEEHTLPDVVLGQTDFYVNPFYSEMVSSGAFGLFSSGKDLIVTDPLNRRTLIYDDLPVQDGEMADVSLANTRFIDTANRVWTDGIKLYITDRQKGVQIWNQIPKVSGALYDRVICQDRYCGSLYIDNAYGIAVYDKKLFLIDQGKKLLIWNEIPESGDVPEPDVIINITTIDAFGVATDGTRLVVCGIGFTVLIWNTIPTVNDQIPDFELEGRPFSFGGVFDACILDNRLYLLDTGNKRVCIYNSFPDRFDQPYDIVIGQDDLMSNMPGKSRKKINQPSSLCFDGEYLWVGEGKWAERVLGFKAAIEPCAPLNPVNVQAEPISNYQIKLSWQDNATNERGYKILYKESDNKNYQIWGYLKASTDHYIIDQLDQNTEYDFRLLSYNSYGESDSSETVIVSTLNEENFVPGIPYNPLPADGQINWEQNFLKLQWSCNDADEGDKLTYNLYFGTIPDPPLHSQNIDKNFVYDFSGGIPGNSTFYWRIIAKDKAGNMSQGPVWSFRTAGPGGWTKMLTIKVQSGGTTNPSPKQYEYDSRFNAKVFAIPFEGYQFDGWTGSVDDDKINDNPLIIDMSRNKVITACFKLNNTEIETNNSALPISFVLYPNYPNPFNTTTIIKYDIPKSCMVELIVYDILGRKVRTLVSSRRPAGSHEVIWNGNDERGMQVGSGIYVYKIKTEKYTKMIKMILIK